MNILFVCTSNKDRSPSLEKYFSEHYPNNEYRSAGINSHFTGQAGTHLITKEDVDWCDIVICAEKVHYDYIREKIGLPVLFFIIEAGDYSNMEEYVVNALKIMGFHSGKIPSWFMYREEMQNQPKKLSEYIFEKNPEINFDKAKEIIALYEEYKSYLRGGGKDGLSHFCDICYRPLSIKEVRMISQADFNVTCSKHTAYRKVYNLYKVRSDLGITSINLLE